MTLKNRRVFELRLGKVGLILFISGISVLLFCIFLLGIVVGKHMEAYPERYASGISDLIREHLFAALPRSNRGGSVPTEPRNRDESAGGQDAESSFSDALIREKEKAALEIPSGTLSEKPSESVPGLPAPVGSRTVEGTTGKAPSLGLSGEGETAKSALPLERKPGKDEREQKRPIEDEATKQGHGQYEVQAAAYREKRQAEQLVKKLSDLGFTHRVIMKDLPGKGRWFRVIAGGFETRAMAQEAADRMAGKVSGLKCIIRPAGADGHATE